MHIASGSIVGGKYRLERPLSRGGMGAVWVARHVHLGSSVAVKFMDQALASTPAFVARFEREARTSARLESPHVVRVMDYGIDSGAPYLVMELLQGDDLGTRLKRAGRLSLPEAAWILGQAGKALRLAHEAGLVHRDLKPGNLFLARAEGEEIVKILDFGIVKETGSKEAGGKELDEIEMTKTGEVLGSPHYMSPEQVRGDRDIDHRSDLWSLGVILFRALTGELPFPGDQMAHVITRILFEPVPRATHLAPHLPPTMEGFFARALARDRAQRFQSVCEMLDELQRIAGMPPRAASIPEMQTAHAGASWPTLHPSAPSETTPLAAGVHGSDAAATPGTLTSASMATQGAVPQASRRRTSAHATVALALGAATAILGAGAAFALRGGPMADGEADTQADPPSVPQQAAPPQVPEPAGHAEPSAPPEAPPPSASATASEAAPATVERANRDGARAAPRAAPKSARPASAAPAGAPSTPPTSTTSSPVVAPSVGQGTPSEPPPDVDIWYGNSR